MPRLKIVLDTKAILRSISRRSIFSDIIAKLYDDAYELYVSNDIGAFSLLPNVKKIDVYYHLNLIARDKDDNKFVDCAFAGNVHFLVTDDKHFNTLKSVQFPVINFISLGNFKVLLAG